MRANIFLLLMVMPLLSIAQMLPIAVPLTDSFSDNRNPEIRKINNFSALMVWEKSGNADSTALFGEIIHPMGSVTFNPFKIAGKAGVHYTHPVLLQLPNYWFPGQDTCLFLFYESDEAGNKDIIFMKYDINGNLFGPFPFQAGPGDDLNLSVSGSSDVSYDQGMVWQSGNKICYRQMIWDNWQHYYSFGNVVVIDSVDCSRPVISVDGMFILYEKIVNGITKIARSEYNATSMTWSAPVIMNKPGVNRNISSISSMYGMHPAGFVWQSDEGNQTHIYGYYFSPWPDSMDMVSAYHYDDPSASWADIIIKSSQWAYPAFLVYDTDSLGNGEVFCNWVWGSNYNLSGNPGPDVHPKQFMLVGFGNWIYEIMVTWESFRNGHWQIWYTYLDMSGGISPLPAENLSISCSPNPFNNDLKIDYRLTHDQEVTFRLYNVAGRKVADLQGIKGFAGGNSFSMQGTDSEGHVLPSGLYLLTIVCDDGTMSTKVIRR